MIQAGGGDTPTWDQDSRLPRHCHLHLWTPPNGPRGEDAAAVVMRIKSTPRVAEVPDEKTTGAPELSDPRDNDPSDDDSGTMQIATRARTLRRELDN